MTIDRDTILMREAYSAKESAIDDPEIDSFLKNWDELGLEEALSKVNINKILTPKKRTFVGHLINVIQHSDIMFEEDKVRLGLM